MWEITGQGTEVKVCSLIYLELKTSRGLSSALRQYYRDLYNIVPHPPYDIFPNKSRSIQDYIQASDLPRLSDHILQALEAPITSDQLTNVLQLSPMGKSPGPDGLPASYYKSLSAPWSMHFLRAYNSIGEGSLFTKDTLRAHITLIPKEGKDHTECQLQANFSL